MVIFWARTLQKSKFHLKLSKFLYFYLRCSKIYSWQETDSSKSWFKIAFHKTWHCISSHEHFISLHCTTCHFEIQNSWFQNFQSRLEFQLFSKLISKPWVFKIINSSHFTPRTLNFKIFSQENNLDSFQYGFQPLHLRFCPFDNFKYLPFTKLPYRGQLSPKIPVLPISPDFMKIPKRSWCFILISVKKQCETHTEVVSHKLSFWKFEFWKTQKYRSLVPWIGATCLFSLLPFPCQVSVWGYLKKPPHVIPFICHVSPYPSCAMCHSKDHQEMPSVIGCPVQKK